MDEIDVDWELTLSIETTLQLLQEETELDPNNHHSNDEVISRILDVCRGRGGLPQHLRGKVWQILLNAQKPHPLAEIYDLKQQKELHSKCVQFVATHFSTLNKAEDLPHLQSTLEQLLTTFYKEKEKFENLDQNLEILKPLLTLNLSPPEIYPIFKSILTNYIPRDVGNINGLPFHIFRLLLLYHEPEVCTLLDSFRVGLGEFSRGAFSTLFASETSIETTLVLWDIYFQYRDPFLVYHMGLVLCLNAKDTLLTLKTSPEKKPTTIAHLSQLPSNLQTSDIPDLLQIATHYSTQTPQSYKKMFESALYGNESFLTFANNTSPCRRVAMHSLCMPVCPEELLESLRGGCLGDAGGSEGSDEGGQGGGVRFFVVDCRPAEMYNCGRLDTAFHLDCKLMLLEPIQFSTAVQGLLLAQKEAQKVGSAAGGEHLLFVGSGREEEDQYVHMVVSSFLQRNVQKVGLLSGGYQALHELLHSTHSLETLADHTPSKCPECTTPSTTPPTTQPHPQEKPKLTLSKLTSTLKQKSTEMKSKLIDYIQNPGGGVVASSEEHVKSSDRGKSKPYSKLLPVFMIDDEGEGQGVVGGGEEGEELRLGGRIQGLRGWVKRRGNTWPCSEVLSDGSSHDGHILVTKDNVYFIRENPEDIGEVSVNRLLSSVIKITSKKKHPELITFKYGRVEGDLAEITHFDRFYLPENSREFVTCVKGLIDHSSS